MNPIGLLLPLFVSFIMRSLTKATDEIKWDKIKLDVEAFTRDAIPGKFFDDEVVAIALATVGIAEQVLADKEDLEKVVTKFVEGQFLPALETFYDLVIEKLKLQLPENPTLADKQAAVAGKFVS